MDVIVIGAGVSGLHAASLLVEQGAKVQVVEAQGRVGGRLLSYRDLEGAPEAGGDSILGGYGRVRDTCAKLGLTLKDFEQRRGVDRPEIALRGQVIPRQTWKDHPLNHLPVGSKQEFPGRRFFEKFVDQHNPLASASDWIEPASQKLDESVYDFLSRRGWSQDAITQNYETNIGRGTSAHDCSILTWYFRRAWDKIQTDIESVALKVQGGNESLPQAMAKKLGDAVILNRPVVGVVTTAAGIQITCSEGSRYNAKFVICATPLAPLRSVRFAPGLPPAVAKAIAVVPSMDITKVFIDVKKPFWESDGFSPAMWTDTLAGEVGVLRQGEAGDRVTGLVARVRGFQSQMLDTLDEVEAGARVVAAIEALRPAAKGQLRFARLKSWARDPYARGTWVEWEPGQVHEFLPELIKPAGRIHFAGEHASLANRGMEAAMEAGERAAFEVMARL
jgi:monoamine oxidase